MTERINFNPGGMPVLEYLATESMSGCSDHIRAVSVMTVYPVIRNGRYPMMSRISDFNWIRDAFLVLSFQQGTCPSPLFNDRISVLIKRPSGNSINFFVCDDREWLWITVIRGTGSGTVEMNTVTSISDSGNPAFELDSLVRRITDLAVMLLAEELRGGFNVLEVAPGKTLTWPGSGLTVNNGSEYSVGVFAVRNMNLS